jgi:LemA protein
MGFVGLILLGLLVVAVLWVAGQYNALVRRRQEMRSAWSQIDVQLKRRHDLIPNLVESVKGYMGHERQTLEQVIQARHQAVSAGSIPQKVQAEQMLTQTLRSLFAVVERYPELKASQNVSALQDELTATENRIGSARQSYNDQVARLNTAIETVPTNIVAALTGFTRAEFFSLDGAAERQAPKVSL